MTTQRKPRLTPQEYLALDRRDEYKNEYLNGEIFAMTDASRRHNLISLNTATSLNAQLASRDCEVYASDMRVKVSTTGLYTYPDVVVVCGAPEFEDEEIDTLINPTVIIEVLSKSTEGYDRGEKFEHYRSLTTLAEFILISQEKYHVEHFLRRENAQWLLSETNDLQGDLELPSIGCRLSLTDIYRKVEIDSA
jgi:Uma2 family endonuclease